VMVHQKLTHRFNRHIWSRNDRPHGK
jgi:hypothetical protein